MKMGQHAPKLKFGQITSTLFNLINSKIFTILHHPYCCYVYTLYSLFAHSSCTYMLILLFIKSTVYYPAHLFYIFFYFIFVFFNYFFTYIYVYSRVVFHILHCPLSGPDLTYISLLIIFCIIEYVTIKP